MKYSLWALLFLSTNVLAAVPGKIHLGLIVPVTRQDGATTNPWGVHQQNGFKLAFRDSQSIVVDTVDNSESAILARQRSRELLARNVDIVAGLSFSDQAVAVKQQLEPTGIPYVTVFGTSEKLFDRDRSVFSMAMSNDTQAKRLAKYLSGSGKIKQEGVGLIVARNCEYCVDMESHLLAELKRLAIPVNRYPDILKNRPLPHDYFDKISPHTAIIVLAYEVEGLSVLNALAQRKHVGFLLGGDTWSANTKQVSANLGLIDRVCLANPTIYDYAAASKENRKFVETYKKEFGEAPSDVAALAFDAGTVIVKAADKCIKAPDHKKCMAEAIAGSEIRGVSGTIRFAKNGKRLDSGEMLKSPACSELERKYGFER